MSEATERKLPINPDTLPDQDPHSTPLEELDVARPKLFSSQTHWAYFEAPAPRGPRTLLPQQCLWPLLVR